MFDLTSYFNFSLNLLILIVIVVFIPSGYYLISGDCSKIISLMYLMVEVFEAAAWYWHFVDMV